MVIVIPHVYMSLWQNLFIWQFTDPNDHQVLQGFQLSAPTSSTETQTPTQVPNVHRTVNKSVSVSLPIKKPKLKPQRSSNQVLHATSPTRETVETITGRPPLSLSWLALITSPFTATSSSSGESDEDIFPTTEQVKRRCLRLERDEYLQVLCSWHNHNVGVIVCWPCTLTCTATTQRATVSRI